MAVIWHPSEGLPSLPVQRSSPEAELRGWKGPFLQIPRFALWVELGCYPHGELRHREGLALVRVYSVSSGAWVTVPGSAGWMDDIHALYIPGHQTPGRTWRGLNLSGDLGWGLGLNLGVWTPFTSPGLSSWENNFFLYLPVKWAQPYRYSSKGSLKVNCSLWHVQKYA